MLLLVNVNTVHPVHVCLALFSKMVLYVKFSFQKRVMACDAGDGGYFEYKLKKNQKDKIRNVIQ